MDLRRLPAALGPLKGDEEPAWLPRGIHRFASTIASSVRRGVDAQPPVWLFSGAAGRKRAKPAVRSGEPTSEIQSRPPLVCRLLVGKKKPATAHTQLRT